MIVLMPVTALVIAPVLAVVFVFVYGLVFALRARDRVQCSGQC